MKFIPLSEISGVSGGNQGRGLPSRAEWEDRNPGEDYDEAMKARAGAPAMEVQLSPRLRFVPLETPPVAQAPTSGGFFDSLGTGMNFVRDWVTGVPIGDGDRKGSVLEGKQIPQLPDTAANRKAAEEANRLVAIGAKKEAAAKTARAKLRVGAKNENYGVTDFAADTGLDVSKGVVKLGESYVGLLDLTSGGAAGRVLAKAGYDPKSTNEFLTGFQSLTRQNANKNVEEAVGFLDTLKEMVVNPTALVGGIAESLPGTVAAGVVGGQFVRFLVGKAAAEASSLGLSGAIAEKFIADKVKEQTFKIASVAGGTEGALSAGSIAEAGRQSGKDWNEYVLPALAAGFGTAAIGAVSGKVAQKFGIGDIETDIAARSAGVKGVGVGEGPFLTKFFKEITKEGFLEEMPQSAQEQIFTNLATGRPWDEGVDKAAAQGLITGVAMAGGHSVGVAALQKTSSAVKGALSEQQGYTQDTTAAAANSGEMGAATPGETAPKADARARRVAELTAQIEASGVSAEDAAVIAENRINEAGIKQEKLGAKILKTAIPTNRVEELTDDLIAAGVLPKEAKLRATAIAEQEEKDDAEAAKAVGKSDRTSTTVAKQPTGATAAKGPTESEPGGVVSTGATAEGPAVGEGTQPAAVEKNAEASIEAPITVAETKTTRGDALTGASTKVKLSDGSEHEINRQDTNTTAGLPGWHDINLDIGYSYLGNTKAEAIEELIRRQERKAEATAPEATAPAPAPATEATATAPATEAPAPATDIETVADQARETIKRGRPKLVLTPEEQASKAVKTKATNAANERTRRAAEKQTTALERAVAQANQTNRRAAYKELLKLRSSNTGAESVRKAIKATLEKYSNRFTPAELETLRQEAKPSTAQGFPSASSATYEADPKLGTVTNGAQAIAQVIKTGTFFQRMLARRIRGFVNGVKVVVVEKGDPLPARLQSGRIAERWVNARGMYVPSEKTVYIRGDSFGNSQGTNNVTILHELLHAATHQKLKLGQLALERGWSLKNAVTLATQDLQRTMDSAKQRFDELSAAGQLPEYIQELDKNANVFSNLDEFLAYGMSDDAMQTFLLGAKGYEGNANFFSRFVNSIRSYFGMDVDSINALSDLVLVTDKLLSARKSPTMRFIEAADKVTAKREELALPSWFGGDKTATSTKVQPSANVARLAKMLGTKLYGTPDDIARVSLKELFQNSFDAIKEGLEKKNEPWHITKGKIDIKVDEKN